MAQAQAHLPFLFPDTKPDYGQYDRDDKIASDTSQRSVSHSVDEGLMSLETRSSSDLTEEGRVKRRREINRKSQRRIRERRNKEIEELRLQVQQLQQDNQVLVSKLDSMAREKTDLLLQVQKLTDKWRVSIEQNSALNKENIELRARVQQLNNMLHEPRSMNHGGYGRSMHQHHPGM